MIHYDGAPIGSGCAAIMGNCAQTGGSPARRQPACATAHRCDLVMQSGIDIAEVSGYLGMSIETLRQVYWHHHPDFQAAAAQATPGNG